MGIDTSKIRVGDEVTVRMAVTCVGLNDFVLDDQFAVFGKNIVAHHPKPREIKAGDEVRRDGKHERWRVLHVHENKAWLDGFGIHFVSDLRHAD